jgi:Leucine-rich repeat (LRR) protein
MKLTRFPGLILLAIMSFAPGLFAQASANTAAKITEITSQFQTAHERDVSVPHAQSLADLDAKYAAAVKRAFDAATQAGNLDDALKLREEMQRLVAKEALPPVDLDSLPESLKQVRLTYRSAITKLDEGRAVKAQTYFDHCDNLLKALQADLTKQNFIADALIVKAKREELLNTRPVVAQAAAPGSVSTSDAPSANSAKAGEIPKGATLDSVIAWVFKFGGEAVVRSNGVTTRARAANDLPPAPYELIEIWVRAPGVSDKEFAQLAAVPTLAVISMNGITQVKSLQPIAGLIQLKTLEMDATSFTDAEFHHLAGLTNLGFLDLDLREASGAGLAHLKGLPKLSIMELHGGLLSEDSAKAISELTSIKTLRLGSLIRRKNEKHLAAIGTMPNLESLSLTASQLGPETFSAVSKLPKLRTLDLRDSQIDNRGFAFLAPCAATLTHLDMQYQTTVSDEGIKHIVAALPNLEIITASKGSTCSAAALRELAKLPKLKQISWWVSGLKDKDYLLLADLPAIERITLNGTAITDDGLAAFSKCQTLQFLNLNGNAITDKGLPHLQSIPGLKEVNLKGTKVTPSGLAAFKQARPEVKVTQ